MEPVLQDLVQNLMNLQTQLPGGHKNKRESSIGALNPRLVQVQVVDDRSQIRHRFASAGSRIDKHVAAREDDRDGLSLNQSRSFEAQPLCFD